MNPVIDDGCPSSVAGLNSAAALADRLNITLKLNNIKKPFLHYFGPEGNSTAGKWTIAEWQMPVRFHDGFQMHIPIACVLGSDPILLGSDFLASCIVNNPGNRLIYLDKQGKRHSCRTYRFEDGHRYLEAAPQQQGEQRYAFYQSKCKTLEQKKKFAEMLHDRTHAAPISLRMLMQRNGIWDQGLTKHIDQVCRDCRICLRTGEPLPARKVSLAHINCEFNSRVGVDFFYWSRAPGRTILCLHAMCLGTSLSEAVPAQNRDMKAAAEIVESLWLHQHGRPVAIGFDPEFNKTEFLEMLKRNGIIAEPRPARRHNKMGRIERKHRTIKLILSRLAYANPLASDIWLVKFATFLSNIMYGNRYASAFELARGYTPSVTGTRLIKVPQDVLEAHKTIIAQRALAHILKTKAVMPIAPKLLTPGTRIYGYVKLQKGHGEWRPYSVIRCDGFKVEVRAAKRGPKTLLALEDVRLVPQDTIAQALMEEELGVQPQAQVLYPSDSVQRQEGELILPPLPLEDNSVETSPPPAAIDTGFDARQATEDPATENLSAPNHAVQEQMVQDDNKELIPVADAPHVVVEQPSTSQAGASNEEAPPSHSQPPVAAEAPEQGDPALSQQPRRSSRRRQLPLRYRQAFTTSLESTSPICGQTLRSDEQRILAELYCKYGNEQYTKSRAPDIPEWLYVKALDEEMANWTGHYRPRQISEIEPGSNLVGSHVVYRIKKNDDDSYRFKARLVVHGNEDVEKDEIRKDAATAHLVTVRFLLSLAVCYGLKLGKVDIKAAYFQSGRIKRQIFVRPPKEMLLFRTVWELIALPYGIVEAGRQWQLASDDFLKSIGMEPINFLPQGFSLRRPEGIVLLVAKVVDDFIIAGTEKALKWFSKKINARFHVGTETYAPEPIRFNGALLRQDRKGSIKVSMEEFANSISALSMTRERRKQQDDPVTADELQTYQSLAGKLNWLGHSVTPHYAFAASYLQQSIGDLRVKHLVQANAILREVRNYAPILIYGRPDRITETTLCTFADASFPKISGSVYGQSGVVCGLVLGMGKDAAFHTLAWSSHKQTRVCRSSTAAEILAIMEGEELGTMLCAALNRVCHRKIPHHLNVDSRSLFEALATQHELKDFRLRQATQSLRSSFETGEISVLRWIAGRCNPSDALTKRSPSTGKLLSNMCSTGRLMIDFANGTLQRSSDSQC